MKDGFLEKLITRLDRFTPSEVQNLVLRLMREKGFMENVFEALQEGVLILDPEGVITFVNHACHTLLGIDTSKSIGHLLSSTVRGIDWNSLADPNQIVRRDMEVFYPENRYLNFYLAPINGTIEGNPEHLGYVMIIHDLTSSKKERQQTIEEEQLNALTFLAAGVAHEIGNPLNSLDIHLQLLARKIRKIDCLDQSNKSDIQQLLGTAQNEIRRLDNILKQFLMALRPQPLLRRKCHLHDILRSTLESIAAELSERSIKVILDLAESLPLLDLDADQIQQALYNLLRNAAQAVPPKSGCIHISTSHTDSEILLTIKDNGSGISPEHMGTLFEPFKTTKKSGTGLGLLIVRRIIRDHGGELEINSEVGQGTAVTLHFPRIEKHIRMLESSTTAKPLIDIEQNS